jgi:hypothetical protein
MTGIPEGVFKDPPAIRAERILFEVRFIVLEVLMARDGKLLSRP